MRRGGSGEGQDTSSYKERNRMTYLTTINSANVLARSCSLVLRKLTLDRRSVRSKGLQVHHYLKAMPFAVATSLLVLGMSSPAYADGVRAASEVRRNAPQVRDVAWAYFRKKCDNFSGEKVYEVVMNVDGILIERPRTRPRERDLADQNWPADIYGLILYPPVEISRYLAYLNEDSYTTKRKTERPGYSFVEVPISGSTKYWVYRRNPDGEGFATAESSSRASRYSIRREDISTKEDRSHWVAGSRLVVFDSIGEKVLGERIGYVFDAGLGSTRDGRRPWLMAQDYACPKIRRNQPIDRLFVEKVLVPATRGRNAE